jgi:hypothetical protein
LKIVSFLIKKVSISLFCSGKIINFASELKNGTDETYKFATHYYMSDRLYIFDTTLRDGEQVPGCQLNTVEKIQVAKQLEHLGRGCN